MRIHAWALWLMFVCRGHNQRVRIPWMLSLSLWAACTAESPKVSPVRRAQAIENVRRDLERSPQALREQVRSDGLTQVTVQRGFRHATIVTRAADGTRRARCVDHPEEAVRMLEGEE